MKRPDLFLVGAPKAGTTSLHAYLAQHPSIFMSDRKEPHYFGTDIEPVWWRIRDEASYLELFGQAREDQWAGESSVWYLFSEAAPAQIKDFSPDAKIIIMVRRPAEAMWALHWQLVRGLYEDILDFRTALEAEPDRALGKRVPKDATDSVPLQYRRVYEYGPQIERYYETFGRDRTHVIVFEEFAADTGAAVRDVFSFLGVDPSFEPDLAVKNEAKAVGQLGVRRALNRAPWIMRSLRKLPPGARKMIGGAASVAGRERTRPPLDEALRAELCEQTRGTMEHVERLIGREIPSWHTPSGPPRA